MRVCIVDDDDVFSQKAEYAVRKYFSDAREEVRIFRYGEGYSLLDSLDGDRNYDLYFLDVEMPEMDGLELAGRILTRDIGARIVLLTSHEKYAVPGFKIRAYYYILKDEYAEEIPVLLDRIRKETLSDEEEGKYYLIQNEVKGERIRFDEILYLTKEKKYVLFHLRGGREYKERTALGEACKRLPKDKFIVVDKGYVINMQYVSGWTGTEIKLGSGADRTEIPVSRRLSAGVKDALTQFWRKK